MGPDAEAKILNFTRLHAVSNRPHPSRNGHARARQASADLLGEIDQIFDRRARSLHEAAEQHAQVDAERARTQEEFSAACSAEIRPAMQAFLDRIRKRGGGGFVEEREANAADGVAPGITLWMSLFGDIIGSPHPDQHPFLQLDLDAAQRQVLVAAGHMWQGRDTSGRVGSWDLAEITSDTVTEELLAVLRKAAG